MKRLFALALIASLSCVINTRPHLPGTDSVDAGLATGGGGRGGEGGVDNLADARVASDVTAARDAPVPLECPDASNCQTPGGDAATQFADAASAPPDAGHSVDVGASLDASQPEVDGGEDHDAGSDGGADGGDASSEADADVPWAPSDAPDATDDARGASAD